MDNNIYYVTLDRISESGVYVMAGLIVLAPTRTEATILAYREMREQKPDWPLDKYTFRDPVRIGAGDNPQAYLTTINRRSGTRTW